MSHFDNTANSWDSPEKIEKMSKLANSMQQKLNINNKVDLLDFGCGTGLLGLEFIKQSKSITGVDTSSGMLEVFDKKTTDFENIRSLNINLEQSSLDEKFDLIISSMAFHHLDAPSATFKKLASMLNEGGRIAIVDLEAEDGTFHPDPAGMGVKHDGFSNEEIKSWTQGTNLKASISTINTISKNDKQYAQFLAIFS